MKKLISLIILFIAILLSTPSYALIHTYKGLTGGANANLDGVPVANISDGEIATGADTSNVWRWYYYDASNNNTTNPESSPDVIVPDDNVSGTGAWILVTSTDTGPSATPGITFEDTGSPGETNINNNSSGDSVFNINVDDSSGDNQTYIQANGTTEEVIINKPIDSSEGIEATYIDAGIANDAAPSSPVTVGSMAACQESYLVGDVNTTFNLPAEPECASGYGKRFCFVSVGPGQITIDPAAGDVMNVTTLGPLAAGTAIQNGAAATGGDAICLVGVQSGTDQWYSESYSGTWASE
jgi:hypothetical protein